MSKNNNRLHSAGNAGPSGGHQMNQVSSSQKFKPKEPAASEYMQISKRRSYNRQESNPALKNNRSSEKGNRL